MLPSNLPEKEAGAPAARLQSGGATHRFGGRDYKVVFVVVPSE
jgi:hypothetical protein